MPIRNLTPYPVVILDPSCCIFNQRTQHYNLVTNPVVRKTLAPENCELPRCGTVEKEIGEIEGIPIISIEFTEIENLPPEEKDTYYIVSAIVANAGRKNGRRDLLVPARMVRDADDGNIVGCLALAL